MRGDLYAAAETLLPLFVATGLSEDDAHDCSLLLADLYHDLRALRIGSTTRR